MVQFETNRYSLPTMYVGERVTVKATADEVKILYKGAIIASHRRVYGQYQEEIKLDHYLELLLQKPRALDNTKVYKPNTCLLYTSIDIRLCSQSISQNLSLLTSLALIPSLAVSSNIA